MTDAASQPQSAAQLAAQRKSEIDDVVRAAVDNVTVRWRVLDVCARVCQGEPAAMTPLAREMLAFLQEAVSEKPK